MKYENLSRREISENIEKNEAKLNEVGEHMDLVVGDKETISETSKKLERNATKESTDAINRSLKNASEASHQEFGRRNQELERNLNECKEDENELSDKIESSKRDAQESIQAAKKIKETKDAKSNLEKAEDIAVKEARILENDRIKQEHNIKDSEYQREQQKRRLFSSTLKL